MAELVTVFSASARPGMAQLGALRQAGYRVRAVSRRDHPGFEGCERVWADLDDPASLVSACAGSDYVLFTSPSFTDRAKSPEQAGALGRAAKEAGVRRLIYNTTSWHPEEITGVPTMDELFRRVSALRESGVPLTVVRPSLFMDNLLTKWVKPDLLADGVLRYPHREDLEVSWICLDDVARVMIATIADESFAGQTIDVGGPETLTPPQVCALLSERLGRPIRYERITARQFGERLYGLFRDVLGPGAETYVADMEQHYLFKNATNPFLVPMEAMQARLGIRMTPMRDWLARQDWTDAREPVGSVSG
ncbi:SDR family oxidoreductase [Rhizorhabdus dicambivorans]|uniref:NmrA-like domain-containing protein n=1 Tax=Rhizorhabdus dicambivorans TaxID=1850238 RepID=A0A2A4FQE3_9SPHN|nr:NmrA family NAD(P)-binding protein [Rhizorhabdus dicambivorans]ATE65634.1 hypothetical protein CMV14_15495 [Rhizorhabdus dicambivorans]PCE40975.1 hypothetical protein COO09_17405 [Rhizorhabdus dicambivorans]